MVLSMVCTFNLGANEKGGTAPLTVTGSVQRDLSLFVQSHLQQIYLAADAVETQAAAVRD